MISWLKSCLLTAISIGILCSSGMGFEFPSSHGMGTGGVSILSNTSPTDLIELPGCATDRFALGFESGYMRRYDLSDLDRVYFAVAGSRGRFFGGIGLAQFGKSDLYAEKTLKASIGYKLRDFSVGGSASAMRVEVGGNYGQFSLATFGLGVGYNKGRLGTLVAADNLTNPRIAGSSEPYRRTVTAVGEWRTAKNLSTAIRVTSIGEESMRYSLGQRIPLEHRSALYWGISTRPVEYGGGIDVATKLFTLTYGANIHPVLGLSHSVSIAIFTSKVRIQPASATGVSHE